VGSAGGKLERVKYTPVFVGHASVGMTAVTGDKGGGAGFLAAGYTGRVAALWQSSDGSSWRRIPEAEQLINRDNDSSSIAAILNAPAGPDVLARGGDRT